MASDDPHYDGLGHHISPVRVYWVVFGALLTFTGLTYAVSFADLGPAALPVAMLVACVKASLVCVFFMHLKYDERFNILAFLSSFFFMFIFFGFTMMDLMTRALINPIEGNGVYEQHNPADAVRPTRANELIASEATPNEDAVVDEHQVDEEESAH
jgi:cytochrome c oxidase subunit 4